MAEVTFNPATGQFEEGNYTQIAQRIEAMQARPDTAALDASEEAHRYRNEGRWIGSEDLARGTGIERTIRSGSGGSKGNAVVGRDYRGSDTIEIQGQRMSLDIAASIGLIKRDSGGGFSFCAFHGRWAPIPRDRGHLFHGIVGSHSRPRAGWPTASWSQA